MQVNKNQEGETKILQIKRKNLTHLVDHSIEDAYYRHLLKDVISDSIRGIAQPGSATALGAVGREFESLYPDQFFLVKPATLRP